MKQFVVAAVLALVSLSGSAVAQVEAPAPVRPESLLWFSPPNNPALQGAWVHGAEQKAGAYILRVKLAAGGRIPPHTHHDQRISTVLSGTLYVGFGEAFDEAKLVAIPAGGVYVVPANVSHFLLARDGDAMYQESGVGPTATVPVKR